jgi:hypothetical protein
LKVPADEKEVQEKLLEELAKYRRDPYGFVLFAYEWGKDELGEFDGPDKWQVDLLKGIRDGIVSVQDALDRVKQFSVGSGHGIGKSAFLCWIIQWSLSTWPDTRVTVTANTEKQLRTKTWPELAKWHRLFIAKHLFRYEATSYVSIDPEHSKTWRADAIPWSETNATAFAGLHNKGKRIVLIFDEASEIAPIIWETAEGALTDEATDILWLAFGNRTMNTGKFAETFKDDRANWDHRCIDSRTSRFSNKALIDRWIKKYGLDSDFVRIRVLGEEPLSNPDQYIPQELISAARGKHLREDQYSFAPVVIACDPAWKGGDSTTIYLRQGLMLKKLLSVPKNDNDVAIANHLARFEDEYKADAVFIDLGYGTGIYSVGKTLGRNWQLISFGGKSSKPGYLNKRAEMYGDLKEWLQQGGALPDDQQLCEELSWIETTPRVDGLIQIIDKEDMEASPNDADGAALTLALPVMKKSAFSQTSMAKAHEEYDPLK